MGFNIVATTTYLQNSLVPAGRVPVTPHSQNSSEDIIGRGSQVVTGRVWAIVGLDYYRIIDGPRGREEQVLSQTPDPTHQYCQYCEGSTYHEYDPYVHAWICQICFAGMIRSDKKNPLSMIRAVLNRAAVNIAKYGYTAEVKKQLREAAEQLQQLAS